MLEETVRKYSKTTRREIWLLPYENFSLSHNNITKQTIKRICVILIDWLFFPPPPPLFILFIFLVSLCFSMFLSLIFSLPICFFFLYAFSLFLSFFPSHSRTSKHSLCILAALATDDEWWWWRLPYLLMKNYIISNIIEREREREREIK